MTIPPPCQSLGPQCQTLRVTLRVGSLEDGRDSLDHEATWLLGHTQRIQFGDLWDDGEDIYVDAVIHVPCRYYKALDGGMTCAMYDFRGPRPRRPARRPQPRKLEGDRFQVVTDRHLQEQTLNHPRHSLPVLNGSNPCATARCETSDHIRRAACCRDLEIEIMCGERNHRLESLVRNRKSPYMCKVEREGAFSISAEVISACDYLASDGVACSLHGRFRDDTRPAKPDLCSEWPHDGKGLHPGCVFQVGKPAGQQVGK